MITALRTQLAAKKGELKKDEGFTLIELLVVILIIGVLAAIAIPVFLGQQAQAQQAAAHANLANAKMAYTSYLVANPDGTTTDATDDMKEAGYPKDGSVVIVTGGENFCLETADNNVRNGAFHLTPTDSTPQTGPCGGADNDDDD